MEQQNILADMQRANKVPAPMMPTSSREDEMKSSKNPATFGAIRSFNKALHESAAFGPDVFSIGSDAGVTGRAAPGVK